jgi:dethiobiotin synthetase
VRIIVVTGTNTGVGKTVVTAALATCALHNGTSVAVVKPVQTGVGSGEPGDLAEVRRLTGLADLHECVRYGEPLAPATAARRVGEPGPHIGDLADRIRELDDRDLVIIEGAGGALVRFNAAGEGLIELAANLDDDHRVEPLLVASSGLGVLNTAALTAKAFAKWSMAIDHVVIADWPAEPELADRCNLIDLADYSGAQLRGVIPSGAGALDHGRFLKLALTSLTPTLGGAFDAQDFILRNSAPLPDRKAIHDLS